MRRMWKMIVALWVVLSLGAAVRADWPERVFAPYMYVGFGDEFKLTAADDACGVKYFTLAFVIARQEGRGKDAKYEKEATWDGRIGMGENYYLAEIEGIRKRGGDVIMSFGGEAGRELAIVEDDPA